MREGDIFSRRPQCGSLVRFSQARNRGRTYRRPPYFFASRRDIAGIKRKRGAILRGFEADDKAAYGTASGAPKVRFFRFPGFADTPALVAWLSAKNIAVFGADLWVSDWQSMTPETELALILSRLDKEKRGILLLHDTKQQTAAMLPDLLQELKKRGYKIVNIVPGTNPAPTRAAPEGWTSATEKIIADVFAKARRAFKASGPAGAAPEPNGPGGNPSPK